MPARTKQSSAGFISLFSPVGSKGRQKLLKGRQALSRTKMAVVAAFVAVIGTVALQTSIASITSYSLWSLTTLTPADTATWDNSPVELGFKFKADSGGSITGVKFYKAVQNTGTHTGSLWTASGTRLATATFTGESSSGWQTVRFAAPVKIAAGTVYVASYHTNTGNYSVTTNAFTGAGYSSGPLHALASTSASPNGVSLYGASGFPTDSYADSNYWVDVMFEPTATPSPTVSSTPVPTVAAPPTSSPVPTAAPTPSATLGLQPYSLGFAPYAYVPWGDISVDNTRAATGVKQYVVAFVNSAGSCVPTWDNDPSLGLNSARGNAIATDIAKLRSNGGDVTVSFGGQGGMELANYCGSVTSLKAAYRSVIDKYSATRVDFDVEGTNATATAANLRRAQTIASLKKDLPGLKVYLTVETDPAGPTAAAKTLITQLRDAGAPLAGVNVMTMYFGANTDDAQATISAAKGTFSALKAIYPANSDADIWKSINLTNNLGTANPGETFTISNAQTVRAWAGAQKIGMLSFWSANRDRPCDSTHTFANDQCTGISQSLWQFTGIMKMPPTL